MEDETDSGESPTRRGSVPPDEAPLAPAMLEIGHVFDALAHSRRRYICYSLLDDTEWTLTDLAARVAAWERGVPTTDVSESRRDGVYVALYHNHVPKLVDEGVVVFDEQEETITTGENADQVLSTLEKLGASLDAAQERHAREGAANDRD